MRPHDNTCIHDFFGFMFNEIEVEESDGPACPIFVSSHCTCMAYSGNTSAHSNWKCSMDHRTPAPMFIVPRVRFGMRLNPIRFARANQPWKLDGRRQICRVKDFSYCSYIIFPIMDSELDAAEKSMTKTVVSSSFSLGLDHIGDVYKKRKPK